MTTERAPAGYDRQLKRRTYDRARSVKPSRRWYKLKAWKVKAAAQLAEEPFCQMCEALSPPKVTEATTADHVIPHREDYELFWRGKLQSLCTPCHSGPKQSAEILGYARGAGEDGWPADPKHPFHTGEPI